MILVYAGIVPENKAKKSEETENFRVRSLLLLDQLANSGATIILPTVAISEILVPVSPSKAHKMIDALQEQFVCPTFDIHAASIAANLWAKHKKLPRDHQYKERHVLKADAMIIASAVAAGATEFYSNDDQCRKLAANLIHARPLPDRPHSLEGMWVKGEIERGEYPGIPKVKKRPKKK